MSVKIIRKTIYFILIAIVTCAAIVSTVKGYHHFANSLPNVDFAHRYTTARLLLFGEDPYHLKLTSSYSQHLEEIRAENPGIALSPVYFPSSLLLILPFAALPLELAAQLWFLVNIFLVILVLYLGFRYLSYLGLNPKVYYIVCCIFISSSPFRTVINHGQLSLVAVSLVCLGYFMEKQSREIASGFFFALGMLKYALTAPFVIFQPLATRKMIFVSRGLSGCRAILLMIILYYFFGQRIIWELDWRGYLSLMPYLPFLDFTVLLMLYFTSFYLAIKQDQVRPIPNRDTLI